VLIVLVVAIGVAVGFIPETTVRQPGALASLRPRVHVHPEVRGVFYAAAPIFIASWAVGGLYLSLGGSLVSGVFGLTNHLLGGLAVAAMAGTGALASIVVGRVDPVRSILLGSVALAAGLAVTVAAIDTGSTAAFFTGTVIAGFGFGSSFLGAFRTVATRVRADDRAATLAAVLVVAYTGFSVPAVIAGFVATHIGLRDTALGYGSGVIALSLAAIAVQLLRTAAARRADPYTQLLALAPMECQATTTD